MKSQNSSATKTMEIRLARRSPTYWRVTFDHPPLNVFGPEGILEMAEIMTALETDEHVKVVVFDSAVEGFFLNHSDFLGKLEDLTGLPAGPTGLQAWPDILVRLSRAPVVSIALIRGRATGNGSEIALACDMRFASREKAILSQFEVGAGLVPGGGPMARLPRLIGRGRALEVLLGADDIRGDLAELYGYVNRSLPDADLTALSMRSRPGLLRSTSGQSLISSALSTQRVCRPMSKSEPGGMRALIRLCDQQHRRESKR
jgi:enoyl-CoA hydratase/carnithine racemase